MLKLPYPPGWSGGSGCGGGTLGGPRGVDAAEGLLAWGRATGLLTRGELRAAWVRHRAPDSGWS
eukprot:491409-Alexandrium_andersonii.AAC.1